MADGRDLIEEAFNIVKETSDGLLNFKAKYPAEAFAEFEGVVTSALKWLKPVSYTHLTLPTIYSV
jgi:hypothetical protein